MEKLRLYICDWLEATESYYISWIDLKKELKLLGNPTTELMAEGW